MKSEDNVIIIRDLVSVERQKTPEADFVFENVNLNIKQGEIFVITGEHGAGKSSLAKAIVGLKKISSGSIYINDKLVIGDVQNFHAENKIIYRDVVDLKRLVTLSRKVALDFLFSVKSQYFKYVCNLKYNRTKNTVDEYFKTDYTNFDFTQENVLEMLGTKTWKFIEFYRNTHVKIMERTSDSVLTFMRQEHILSRLTEQMDKELFVNKTNYFEKIAIVTEELKLIKKCIREVREGTFEVGKKREHIHELFKSPKEYYQYALSVIDNVVHLHKVMKNSLKIIDDYMLQIVSLSSPLNKRKKYINHYNKLINLPRNVITKDFIQQRKKVIAKKLEGDSTFTKQDLYFFNFKIKNFWHRGLINFKYINKYFKLLEKKINDNWEDKKDYVNKLIGALGSNLFEEEVKTFHREKVLTNQYDIEDVKAWKIKVSYVLKVIKRNVMNDRELIDKWHEFKGIPYKMSREKIAEYERHLTLLERPPLNDMLKGIDQFKTPSSLKATSLRKDVQYIFRRLSTVMNEKMNVEQIMMEAVSSFPEIYKQKEIREEYLAWYNKNDNQSFYNHLTLERVRDLDVMRYIILKTFRVVGLTSNVITQYPNELTSAQMTRIALARALVVQPKLIIVDEPTSALDATFSVIYLDLLKKIRDEFGISLIIIDNDIHFARQYADRIAIMNNGRVVEVAETKEILTRPLHAYTQKMVEALPIMKIDYVRPDIVPFKHLSKIDYLVDIPITMEVFPDHFAYLRDNEFDAIQKKYATNKKVEQKGND